MAVGAETRAQLRDKHGIPPDRVRTVAQIADRIDDALEDKDLQAAHVIGEVSNIRDWKDHCFFTIKDGQAKLSCVLFSRHIEDYRPQEGDRVLVRGEIDFYHDQGSLSLQANTVIPLGEGRYYRELRQRKQGLREEGMFERNRDPPRLPERVGLVTGADSDALGDVRDSLWSRNPGVDIVHAPASVQGEGAIEELTTALEALDDRGLDAIIIARGGGDIEALKPFNTTEIAEAIASTQTQIITGIGHQEDETIAGLTADVQGLTPTDAGRKATKDTRKVIKTLDDLEEQIKTSFQAFTRQKRQDETIRAKERRETIYQIAIAVLILALVLGWWLL